MIPYDLLWDSVVTRYTCVYEMHVRQVVVILCLVTSHVMVPCTNYAPSGQHMCEPMGSLPCLDRCAFKPLDMSDGIGQTIHLDDGLLGTVTVCMSH